MKNWRMIAWQSTRQPDADCTEMSLHGHPGPPGRLADIERRRGPSHWISRPHVGNLVVRLFVTISLSEDVAPGV
jgi:hypothetical protein